MTMHRNAANAKACAILIRILIASDVPDVITSDRGPQFVSDLWIEMCPLMGIARKATNSKHEYVEDGNCYHPQHNGKFAASTTTRCELEFWEAQTGCQSYGNSVTVGNVGVIPLRAAANLEIAGSCIS